MTRPRLTSFFAAPLAALAAIAVMPTTAGASGSAVQAGSPSPALKQSFAVFRRAQKPRDVPRTRRGDKRAQARAAGARLVNSAPKVYFVPFGSRLCMWVKLPAAGAEGCSSLGTIRSSHPPALYLIGRDKVTTVIPIVDGIRRVTRIDADGTRRQLPGRNNVIVDISANGGRIEWTGPTGPVSVLLPKAGSI